MLRPRLSPLLFAAGLFTLSPRADAGADDCGDVAIASEAACTWYEGAACEDACGSLAYEPACVAQQWPACAEQCSEPLDQGCLETCGGPCAEACSSEAIECNVHCVSSCVQTSCMTSCDDPTSIECLSCTTTCTEGCALGCDELGDEATCVDTCNASCTSSCQAQACIGEELSCQVEGFEECAGQTMQACLAGCADAGALECDGAYVPWGDTPQACLDYVTSLGATVERPGQGGGGSGASPGDDAAGCSHAGGVAPRPTWLVLLGVAAAAVLGRRRPR